MVKMAILGFLGISAVVTAGKMGVSPVPRVTSWFSSSTCILFRQKVTFSSVLASFSEKGMDAQWWSA
jgi:hypothetical protein